MRFLWICILCLWSVSLFAEVQKAQIIQTYAYEVKDGDFKQRVTDEGIEIYIQSKDLLDFINADNLEGKMERQVVCFDDAYTEFKTSPQEIRAYSNVSNAKLKFNFTQVIYELDYIGDSTYKVKNAIQEIAEISQCKVLIQKTLTNLIDGRKDFVINLDNQRYFGKVLETHRYLQCSK